MVKLTWVLWLASTVAKAARLTLQTPHQSRAEIDALWAMLFWASPLSKCLVASSDIIQRQQRKDPDSKLRVYETTICLEVGADADSPATFWTFRPATKDDHWACLLLGCNKTVLLPTQSIGMLLPSLLSREKIAWLPEIISQLSRMGLVSWRERGRVGAENPRSLHATPSRYSEFV